MKRTRELQSYFLSRFSEPNICFLVLLVNRTRAHIHCQQTELLVSCLIKRLNIKFHFYYPTQNNSVRTNFNLKGSGLKSCQFQIIHLNPPMYMYKGRRIEQQIMKNSVQ